MKFQINKNIVSMGSLEVITGSMFSGKSEELIRRLRRAKYAKQKIVVFSPSIDNRYGEKGIYSHGKESLEAYSVNSVNQMEEIMTENNFLEEKSEDKTLLLEEKIEVKNEKLDNVGEKIYNIEESNLEKILSLFDEETKNTIEQKALENIKKEVDNNNIDVILNVKNFSKTMYYKMIGTSIMKILKAEYSEILENVNENDK